MARSRSESPDPGLTEEQDSAPIAAPRRINVAVSPDMLAAIDLVVEREGVSLTEAVRRLVGYGEVMYRAVKEERQSVVFRSDDGREREVLLI